MAVEDEGDMDPELSDTQRWGPMSLGFRKLRDKVNEIVEALFPGAGWEHVYSRRVTETDVTPVDTGVDYDGEYEYLLVGLHVADAGDAPAIVAGSEQIAGILVAQTVDAEGTQGGGFAFSPDGGVTVIESNSSSLVAHLDAKGKAEGMSGFDLTRPDVLASFRYDGAGGISLELRVVIPDTSATYGVIARRRVAG